MEEMIDTVRSSEALDAIKGQIYSRETKRAQLWEQIVRIDGEMAGLREAEHQVSKLPGYMISSATPRA
jgi:hypothetical protein